MASLRFILDTDDDPSDRQDPRSIQKDKDAATVRSRSQDPSTSARASHASSSNRVAESNLRLAAAAAAAALSNQQDPSSNRVNPTSAAEDLSESNPSLAAAAASSTGQRSTSPSRVVPTFPGEDPTSSSPRSTRVRRHSAASDDSMDQAGYGSAASSSSRGGGRHPPRTPMRPMPSAPGVDGPVKLTPVTRRISRAKKGVPVHVCETCRPPKTFTRAEHLRRHQLSHQEARYPCVYPGCEKVFHRPDLLNRHLQRHQEEPDKAYNARTRRTSQSSVSSQMSIPVEGKVPIPRLSSQGMSASPSVSGRSGAASTTTAETPSNQSIAGGPSPFHNLGGAGDAGDMTMSANQMDESADGPYGSSAPPSQSYGGYTLSPDMSVMQPPSLNASPIPRPAFQSVDYHQPRTAQAIPLFLVTQGLPLPSHQVPDATVPPELSHAHDVSPWASSTSDSTYSTPSDISRNFRYRHSRHQSADWESVNMLSPYPSAPQRDLHHPVTTFDSMAASTYFINQFPLSPHTTMNQGFGSMLDVSMGGFPADGHAAALMDPTPTPHMHRHHVGHRHMGSLSSVRSSTPPLPPNSTQPAEALVTPSTTVPTRISAMANLGRQKEMVMGTYPAVDMGMGPGVLGSTPFGSGGNSPGGNVNGILAAQDLATVGACSTTRVATGVLLSRTLRNAIPGYIELYWERFHSLYPIIHRHSFETAGEDVLRCAMAAVGTQYLDGKEDRIRGNQLHEAAWQEVKMHAQWSLQDMQAILLCEFFARFRGRKAVTRPSKPFESLYSRVRFPNPTLYETTLAGDHSLQASQQQPQQQQAQQHQHQPQFSSNEERWHTWLDTEARRRLLTACFVVDVHTAIYYEQRRAVESDSSSAPPTIPLTGQSRILWDATSADEWAAVLASNPEAGTPRFIPDSESLTGEDILTLEPFDCAAILAAETLRLPRRVPGSPISPQTATPTTAILTSPRDGGVGGGDLGEMGDQQQQQRQFHAQLTNPTAMLSESPIVISGLATVGQDSEAIRAAALRAEARLMQVFGTSCPVANTYLALHHTPLHDLLAVSGDSWVLSQKVLHQTSFVEHQKRLKAWVEGHHQQQHGRGSTAASAGGGTLAGLSAAKAAVFAARAIVAFLDREQGPRAIRQTHTLVHGQRQPSAAATSAAWMDDISDYWALYVCALICWAFVHRASRSGDRGAGSASSAAAARPDDEEEEAAAKRWLHTVVRMWGRPEDTIRARARREPGGGGVVGLVRRRLEAECVGARSRLFVDAVGVLKKLEEGVNWKWF